MPYRDREAKRATDRASYLRTRERHSARSRARGAQRRVEICALLTRYLADHHCVDCGEADPVVLDFDHVGEKSFGISTAQAKLVSDATLTREIAKCEVRCANCHRRRTYAARGYRSRDLAQSEGRQSGPQGNAQNQEQSQ